MNTPIDRKNFLLENGWTRNRSYEDFYSPPPGRYQGTQIYALDDAYELATMIPPPAEEKNVRLAQTQNPDGTTTEREWTVHERFMLYTHGFRHGAAMHAMDENKKGLGAYDRGYSEGCASRQHHITAYAKEIGHVPNILRTEERRCTCQYMKSIGDESRGERIPAHACAMHPRENA